MITCEFEHGNKADLRHVTTAVIALKDDRILLTKRAMHLLEGGKFGLLGGFLDRDETLREGARREVIEETGYDVELGELFYITDNPFRRGEDRQNINFVFIGTLLEKIGEPDDETMGLEWFSLDALPPDHEIAFDFAEVLHLFVQHRKRPIALPYFWSKPV